MERDYRIIALNHLGQWSASFDDAPELGFGGPTPREAAQRLTKGNERIDLDSEKVVEVGTSEGDGRLELVVRVTSDHG